MSSPFTASFTTSYEAAVNDAERLLQTFDPPSAQQLAAIKSPTSGSHPVVAVVGEAKRGKSSLVNALLRQPGISPIGVTETTAAPIAFRYGSAPLAEVYVVGADGPIGVPHEDLQRWVTVQGAEVAERAPTRWVDVQLPLQPLKSFTLVDTPGLGGLSSSVGNLTLEAIGRATVLVFVAECHSELTSIELEFLRAAADRVDTVLVVLASAGDLSPDDLALVVEGNRRRVRDAIPRLEAVTFLPVDYLTAERALRSTDAEGQSTRWERSGFAALEQQLVAVTANRGWSLLYLNTLRVATAALTVVDTRLAVRAAALDDPARLTALQDERGRLLRSRRVLGRTMRAALNVTMNNARLEIGRHISRLLLHVEEAHAATIRSGKTELRSLPELVAADLEGVCAELAEHLGRIADRLATDSLDEMFTPDDLASVTEQLGQRIMLVDGTSRVLPTGDRDVALTIASSAGVAFMAGKATMMAAGLAPAALAAAPLIVPVVAVGLGITAAGALARMRTTRMRRAEAATWLTRSIPEIRAELTALAVARLNEVQSTLTLALDDVLDERLSQLDEQIRQIEADRKTAAAAPATIKQSRAQLAHATARLDKLTDQLRATPSTTPSPAPTVDHAVRP